MSASFHKPVLVDSKWLSYVQAESEEQIREISAETAKLLLTKLRSAQDLEGYQRLLAYIDQVGIEELAELWATAPKPSLAATLWRIYQIRLLLSNHGETVTLYYRVGTENLDTVDVAIAGAITPTTPEDLLKFVAELLQGIFLGDFALALNRAAAFFRVCSVGVSFVAKESELTNPDREAVLVQRAESYLKLAAELDQAAKLWNNSQLS